MNDNQTIVFNHLKELWQERKQNSWFPFDVTDSISGQFWRMECEEDCKPYLIAYGELTPKEQFEVLQEFGKWGAERE